MRKLFREERKNYNYDANIILKTRFEEDGLVSRDMVEVYEEYLEEKFIMVAYTLTSAKEIHQDDEDESQEDDEERV